MQRSYGKAEITHSGLSIGSERSGPRFKFSILTGRFLDEVTDDKFNISFAVSGNHVGEVTHVHGFHACDNGGQNSQPILSVEGLGGFDETGLRLLLKGRLGAYNEDDLGDYGTKHEPSNYSFEIALTWDQLIQGCSQVSSFANKQAFGAAKEAGVFQEQNRTEDRRRTSHKFEMGASFNLFKEAHKGLMITVDDLDSYSKYHFEYLNGDFLQGVLRSHEFRCDVAIQGENASYVLGWLKTNVKDQWSQRIRSCRVVGFLGEHGLTLNLSGITLEKSNSENPAEQIRREFDISFFCCSNELFLLLGYRFLRRAPY